MWQAMVKINRDNESLLRESYFIVKNVLVAKVDIFVRKLQTLVHTRVRNAWNPLALARYVCGKENATSKTHYFQ